MKEGTFVVAVRRDATTAPRDSGERFSGFSFCRHLLHETVCTRGIRMTSSVPSLGNEAGSFGREPGACQLFLRIDDRLIHGQVVVKWLRTLGCKDVWVIDDELASDAFMQSVLRLAAPEGVRVQVVSVEDALHSVQRCPVGRPALLLLRSPQTALRLWNGGLLFSELNVGGLAAASESIRLHKSVSATAEQLRALQTLASLGVLVYVQMVPEDRPISLQSIVSVRETASNQE
jgi:D-glucosaminate-specific PTS system IIB component